MKAYQGHADNQSHRPRFRVSVAVAAFALVGCNSNQGVNLSSRPASEVFAGHFDSERLTKAIRFLRVHPKQVNIPRQSRGL